MPEAAASEHLICICPICRTRFRASDDLLKVAGGQVRCGACLVVFNGHDHQVPQTPSNNRRPAVEGAAGGAFDVPAAEATAASQPPSTAADGPQTRMADQLAMAIGILALAALLVVNVFWLRWESWSRQPALRGIYASACSVVGCDLPRLRAVADVELTSHGFQPRRGPPEALALALELRNLAPFAQPFPTLLARLLDARGTVLATHRLAAKDYLEAAATKPFAPGHKVSIVLRFDDPGVAAVAYSLSLL